MAAYQVSKEVILNLKRKKNYIKTCKTCLKTNRAARICPENSPRVCAMLLDTTVALRRTQKNYVPYQEHCEFEEFWILGVLDFKRANK